MPTTAAILYSEGRLDPLFNPGPAMNSMINVALKASQTLAAGTILGEVAASPGTYGPYSSTDLAAGPYTVTGGTYTASAATLTGAWGGIVLVGSQITVAGFTGAAAGYNGTYTVTASAAGTLTYANTTNAAYAGTGTITTVNPLAVPTFGAQSGSGGVLGNGVYLFAYAYRNANGSTPASPSAGATLSSTSTTINVATITLPAGATSVDWYMSDVGSTELQFLQNNAAGTGFAVTTLPLGGAAAPPTASTALASVDGTQNPAVILAYPATTDSSGNITNPSEWIGVTETTVPCYTQGTFKCADLVGLDANAVTKLHGHLIEGTTSAGVFSF